MTSLSLKSLKGVNLYQFASLCHSLFNAEQIESVEFGDMQIQEQAYFALIQIPTKMPHLEILKLPNCELGKDPKMLKLFANSLKNNLRIRSLDISSNNIGEHGGRLIASYLTTDRKLEVLNVASNSLNKSGSDFIADALLYHRTLVELDISDNNITSEGFLHFVPLVKANHPLKKVSFAKNIIVGY